MSKDTLFDKVWDLHKVSSLSGGSDQIFIGLHLIHEVTSPQAFGALKDKNLKVKFPTRTVATVDHIVPTDNQSRPFKDNLAEYLSQKQLSQKLHELKYGNLHKRLSYPAELAPILELLHALFLDFHCQY